MPLQLSIIATWFLVCSRIVMYNSFYNLIERHLIEVLLYCLTRPKSLKVINFPEMLCQSKMYWHRALAQHDWLPRQPAHLAWLDVCKESLVSVAQLNFCACSKGENEQASTVIMSYLEKGNAGRDQESCHRCRSKLRHLPSFVDIPLRKFKMGNKFLASCMSMCTCQTTRIPQLSTSFAFTTKPEKKRKDKKAKKTMEDY